MSHVPVNFRRATNSRGSEEQEPLERFLKAKSIKVRNEMAEEVRIIIYCNISPTGILTFAASNANVIFSPKFSKPPSKNKPSTAPTKKSFPPVRPAAPPTKTPKKQTRTLQRVRARIRTRSTIRIRRIPGTTRVIRR